jgi:ribosome-binding protein aMBF1 (putative translation factor)
MTDKILPVKCEICGLGGSGYGWGRVCENCHRFICNECWELGKDQNKEFPDCEHRTISPKQSSDLLNKIRPKTIINVILIFLLFGIFIFLFWILSR